MARTIALLLCALLLCFLLCPVAMLAFTSSSASASLGPHPPAHVNLSQEMSRDLRLDYSSDASARVAEDTLQNIVQGKPSLNALTVGWHGYRVATNWTLLAKAIVAAQDLAALHWENDNNIPQAVLSVLETWQPDCKLHYTMPFYDRYDYEDEDEDDEDAPRTRPESSNIFGHPSLYALKASISYGREPNEHDMALVQQILETCPNLRELDLHVSRGGCVVASNQPFAFDFTKSNNRFSPLTTLRLTGYRLEDKFNGRKWMEWEAMNPLQIVLRWPWNLLPKTAIDWISIRRLRHMGGVQEDFVKRDYSPLPEKTPINLDAWFERMDWSHLTTLELKSASSGVLQKLAPVLTNLTSFTVGYADGEGLQSFIEGAQRPLELISIRNSACIPLDSFVSVLAVHHGSVLKSFTFLGSQLNVSHVAELRKGCPKLETLDLKIERVVQSLENDTWTFDYKFLDRVVEIPTLKHFNIRFESADDTDIRLGRTNDSTWYYDARKADPLLNHTSVEDLFKYLNEGRQALGMDRLLQLGIYVGDWEYRHASSMIGPPKRLLGRWTCMDSEGAGKCSGGNVYPSYYGSRDVEEPYSLEEDWIILGFF